MSVGYMTIMSRGMGQQNEHPGNGLELENPLQRHQHLLGDGVQAD